MTDFPTVGLAVDLSGIDKGEKAYDKLQKTIAGVGAAADKAATSVQGAVKKKKAAVDDGAKAVEKAAQKETAAAAKAAKEQERQRKYLLQVRINSIKMEEAARRADEARQVADATKLANQRIAAIAAANRAIDKLELGLQKTREKAAAAAASAAKKAADDTVKAERQAAKSREAIENSILAFKIRMRGQEFGAWKKDGADVLAFQQRMWGQQIREAQAAAAAEIKAEAKATAEKERLIKYLQQVRATSLRWEAAANEKAAREAAAAARRAASGGGMGRPPPISGGGGSGFGGPTPGDMSMVQRFGAALGGLRQGLAETRRLLFDLRTAVGVFLGAMIVRPIVEMADAMTALKARAGAFTEQASDVPYLMEGIYAAAQRSRVPLDALATLYTRMAPLAKELGKSQMDLLKISETVAKGFTIGGATPEEAKAASQQLAQALASNRLGGDELRSLAENAPILMAKISQALGMNTGEFIKWAHAGHANAKVVTDAIEAASADINRIFDKMPVTIGQSVVLVKNAFENLIGKVNEATGASAGVAGLIAQFAGFLEADKTVRGLTVAVNGLAAAARTVGAAFSTMVDYLPAIAVGIVAVAAAIATTRGWAAMMTAQAAATIALNSAILAGQVPLQALGANMGFAARAGSALASVGTALKGALLAILSPVNVVALAVIGLAVAWNMARDNANAAANAFKDYANNVSQGGSAIERAIALSDAYGGSSNHLNEILGKVVGTIDDRTGAEDHLATAAENRLKLEKLMAEAALATAAADARATAASSRRQAAVAGFFATTNEIASHLPGRSDENRRLATESRNNQQILLRNAQLQDSLAGQLDAARADVHGQTWKVTAPTTRTTPHLTDNSKPGPADRTAGFDADVQRRKAELDQQIAAAKKAELEADLQIVGSAQARAELAQRIDQAEYDKKIADYNVKIAGLDREIASVIAAKHNTHKEQQVAALQELKAGYESLKSAESYTQTMKDLAVTFDEIDRMARDDLDLKNQALQNQVDLLGVQADSLKSNYARAAIELQIQKLKQQQAINEQQLVVATTMDPKRRAIEQARLDGLIALTEAENNLRERDLDLINAIEEAANAVASFKSALKRHDWVGVFDALQQTIQTIQASFQQNGMAGGMMTAGSAVGSMVGGKAGSAISNGLGAFSLASSLGGLGAAGGLFSAGSSLVVGGSTIASGIGAGALGGLGLGGAFAAIGAIAPYLAVIAALAPLFLGSKPSNHAGIAQLDMQNNTIRPVSSGKETEETTKAANGAAQAILAGQKLLQSFGGTLHNTVSAVDLGTRDNTRIVMSDGSEFRTGAVGDPQEAAAKALEAVLSGATFVDQAQEKLVRSMQAAGKGFDDIAAALQTYAQAQGVLQSINDQILQLSDPQAFDLQGVTRGIQDQIDAATALRDAGYLTAAQFDEINVRLGVLKGLQIDDVMKRYTDAVSTAASRLSELQGKAMDRARSDLQDALNRETAAHQGVIDQVSALRDTLKAFKQELATGDVSAINPGALYAVRRGLFDSTAGLAASGDAKAMADLPQISRDYLAVAKSSAKTELDYARDVALVRNAVEAAEMAAGQQVDIAQRQLDAANAAVAGILLVNQNLMSLTEAVRNFQAVTAAVAGGKSVQDMTVQRAQNSASKAGLTDQQAMLYLASNKDLQKNWDKGGILTTLGPDIISAVKAHYLRTGQYEQSLGLRPDLGFATGGSFQVGGSSFADSQDVAFKASPGEVVNVERPGQSERLANAVDRMAADISELRKEQFAIGLQVAKNTGTTAKVHTKWDGDGTPAERTL